MYNRYQTAPFLGQIPQGYHQPMTSFGAIPNAYHQPMTNFGNTRVQNRYAPQPFVDPRGVGNCLPCQRAAGLGQANGNGVTFDWKRDATAGALAFAVPTLYHYTAPKKWRRFGPVGNIVAVVGLYFFYGWAYGKLAATENGQ
jgi:hypothetical protein